MKTFIIDNDNHVIAHASQMAAQRSLPKGASVFSTEAELQALVGKWPGARLVAVWNGLPGVPSVKKFTDRSTALRRLWKALQQLAGVYSKAAGRRGK